MKMSEVLPYLCCPKSHSQLVLDGDRLVSTDPATRLCYAIIEQIPVLIPEEASILPEEEWGEVMRKTGRDPSTGNTVLPSN